MASAGPVGPGRGDRAARSSAPAAVDELCAGAVFGACGRAWRIGAASELRFHEITLCGLCH